MKLSKAVEGYTTVRLGDGLSMNTLAGYTTHFNQLIQFLGDVEIERITQEDISKFFAWLRTEYEPKRVSQSKAPLKTSTLRNAWCAVRSLFNWFEEHGNQKKYKRPDTLIKKPIVSYPEIIPFKEEEISALLKACLYTRQATKKGSEKVYRKKRPTALRDTLMILFLLDTGLRASELASIKMEDVDEVSGEVSVKPINSSKKNKPRTVYIGLATKKALWKYKNSLDEANAEEELFRSIDNHPMNRTSVREALMKIGKRTDVANVYPHRFRHTFAIEYLRNGGDIFTLQRLLGHSSLDMVKHYLSIAQSDIAQAHKHASPVDRWHL